MNAEIKIFSTPEKLVESFADSLVKNIAIFNNDRKFNIALSGGNTPRLLFKIMAEKYSKNTEWTKVNLFWGDERCVPPDNSESNYGMTKNLLLNYINIPSENIFRIKGEDNPDKEAMNYSNFIKNIVPQRNELPSFDIILLGLGEDGHTASIFPDQLHLLDSNKICEVATHTVTLQKRITLSGKVINNAARIVFLVTGKNKSMVVSNILDRTDAAKSYPAFFISPTNGILEWYLDKDASMGLQQKRD